jgi:thiamine-phosphate pyrophosphorylase
MSRGSPGFRLPHALYPIVDVDALGGRDPLSLVDSLLGAEIRLLQLRAKAIAVGDLCALARAVQARMASLGGRLIVNDRADVARLVGAAGVHLGQTDLPPVEARRLLGAEAIIGLSTHDAAQVAASNGEAVDYIGFGPIFPTRNKANPDAVQGVAGLRRARALTALPIVAIGGIEEASAAAVLDAGADAVAMIGALAAAPDVAALARRLRR